MRLWSPGFRINFFQQGCMSSELSRQSSDSICEMSDGRIETMFLHVGRRRSRGIADERVLAQGRADSFGGSSWICTSLSQRCSHVRGGKSSCHCGGHDQVDFLLRATVGGGVGQQRALRDQRFIAEKNMRDDEDNLIKWQQVGADATLAMGVEHRDMSCGVLLKR